MTNFNFQPRMDIYADEVSLVQNVLKSQTVLTFNFIARERVKLAIKEAVFNNIKEAKIEIETSENRRILSTDSDSDEDVDDVIDTVCKNIRNELKTNGFIVILEGHTLTVRW